MKTTSEDSPANPPGSIDPFDASTAQGRNAKMADFQRAIEDELGYGPETVDAPVFHQRPQIPPQDSLPPSNPGNGTWHIPLTAALLPVSIAIAGTMLLLTAVSSSTAGIMLSIAAVLIR